VTGKAVGRRWVVDPEKGPSFNKKDWAGRDRPVVPLCGQIVGPRLHFMSYYIQEVAGSSFIALLPA
jgi:hypothetical protein